MAGLTTRSTISASRQCPDDEERLSTADNLFGQLHVRRFVGQILLASVEPDEGPPTQGGVVANQATLGRIPRFQRVEH